MNVRYILVLVGVLIVIVFIKHFFEPKVIFTCTTFFDFEKMDRWASFQKAVDTIHKQNTLNLPHAWFIVNEYSAAPRADWSALMADRYPQMTFVQKTLDQKGQAHSLNLILAAVRPYDYWVQWEDSWFPERPFLARGLDVMTATNVSQLQVTHSKKYVSWLDVPQDRQQWHRTWNGTDYVEIKEPPEIAEYMGRDAKDYTIDWNKKGWPLFSLQPSINRVSHIRCLGNFSTDPVLWPVKFEWEYGRRWLQAGGTKAVLPDGPVIRPGHVSTYAK